MISGQVFLQWTMYSVRVVFCCKCYLWSHQTIMYNSIYISTTSGIADWHIIPGKEMNLPHVNDWPHGMISFKLLCLNLRQHFVCFLHSMFVRALSKRYYFVICLLCVCNIPK